MTARKTSLDRIEITSPCNADWDEMTGSEQIRYCTECNKYVYNLSAMTRRDAEELVATRRSQMCTRMTRDLNGGTITVDSLPPVRLLGRRPGPIASTVVSTILSIAPGVGAISQSPQASSHVYSQNESARKASRSVPGATTGALTGTVSDESGTLISGAVVTITSEAAGDVLSQITSETGEFRFDGLSARTYIFEIKAKGYQLPKQHGLDVQSGEVHRMDVVMEKEVVVMGAMGIPVQPLRALYLESDRVVVATVGKGVAIQKDGSSTLRKTSLAVSQTIKGDGHKPVIDMVEWDYMARQNMMKEGDTVLAFLQRKEDARDAYEPIYGSSSVKKLSETDLATYVRRLGELRELMGRSDSDPKDITEWLVQCAEDPVTKWEGTFELELSAWQEERQRQDTDRLNSMSNESSPTAVTGESAANTRLSSKKVHDPEPTFAALLTNNQKDRLVKVLLKSNDLENGNFELIEIAKSWKDARLLPYLMSHLNQVQNTAPHSAERVMQIIADLLDDEKVSALLDQYRNDASYEDLEVNHGEVASDSSADEDEDEDEDETEQENGVSVFSGDAQAVKPRLSPEQAKLARAALLKKFIVAAQAKINQNANQLK